MNEIGAMMKNDKINILYVDDEMNNLISFKAAFRVKYTIFTAISGEEAIKILHDNPINIIITDQRMPHMTGVEFLENILGDFPDPIRILLTGYADMNAVVDAVNKGKIFHYLTKPWNEEELDMTINRGFEVWQQMIEERENTRKVSVSNEQLEFLLRQKLLS
jgi:response regulator RpfG family c-di-GMP phosphodiesterase